MNIDIVLFAFRIVLVALLYIFLFAVMKTGVGLVRGQRRDAYLRSVCCFKPTGAILICSDRSEQI